MKYLNLCVLLGLMLWVTPARALEITVAAHDSGPAMQAFVDKLAAARPRDQVRFVAAADLPHPAQMKRDSRLILIGPQLLDWRQRTVEGPPTLVLQVSRVQARTLLDKRQPPGITLLWSDPPLARQLNLIRELLPHAQRIGVLYGNDSGFLINELRQAAARHDLQISAQFWPNSNDTRPLNRLLDYSDVLLGLDDAQMFNSSTIKTLLLSSYGRRVPLIGPTAAFVRAGSLASSYSGQDEWLNSLDQLLDRDPQHWPASAYPEFFQIMSNSQVGRSLGIALDDEGALVRRLEQLEASP